MTTMPGVLIADDEESIRAVLARALEKAGFDAVTAQNGGDALELLKTRRFDAALLDVRMPGLTGIEILARKHEFLGKTPVIVMTAQDTLDNAVTAMKNGAFDYLTKPFNLEEVTLVVRRAEENARLNRELTALRENGAATPSLVGRSRAMTEIFKTVGKLADQDVTVLVTGESGTGKEVIARAIHGSGARGGNPFVALNCSAIPENLLESELFGHKKGAFTGADADRGGLLERARDGTVFLDEIGDMPLALQAKLLRFLQDKTFNRVGDGNPVHVDARVIAATHRDLPEAIRAGKFREDLYFRLNVVPIAVPPLRQRREDVRPLTEHFAAKYGAFFSEGKRLAPDAVAFLESRDWPGNVRELENAVKRLMALSRGSVVTRSEAAALLDNILSDSPEALFESAVRAYLQSLPENGWHDVHEKILGLAEKPLFREVLDRTGGNRQKAADILGMNRNTFRERLKKTESR